MLTSIDTQHLRVGPASPPQERIVYSCRLGEFTRRAAAALLLLASSPLLLLLMGAVRITSPGPAVYRQTRVGRGGKIFNVYKLRTMRHDAERTSGPVWCERNDPRITWLGKLLRKTHLDEFPQLVNVLRGEMALIGPRPERPEFVERLAIEIPGYMERLTVLPGVTGLAQINLPPDTDMMSVRRKLVLDCEYIRASSPLLDSRIFACTLLRLLGIKGLWITKAFLLDRTDRIESLLELHAQRFARNGHCQEIANGSNGHAHGHNGTGSSNGHSKKRLAGELVLRAQEN